MCTLTKKQLLFLESSLWLTWKARVTSVTPLLRHTQYPRNPKIRREMRRKENFGYMPLGKSMNEFGLPWSRIYSVGSTRKPWDLNNKILDFIYSNMVILIGFSILLESSKRLDKAVQPYWVLELVILAQLRAITIQPLDLKLVLFNP